MWWCQIDRYCDFHQSFRKNIQIPIFWAAVRHYKYHTEWYMFSCIIFLQFDNKHHTNLQMSQTVHAAVLLPHNRNFAILHTFFLTTHLFVHDYKNDCSMICVAGRNSLLHYSVNNNYNSTIVKPPTGRLRKFWLSSCLKHGNVIFYDPSNSCSSWLNTMGSLG
jgi:hypothetical protein